MSFFLKLNSAFPILCGFSSQRKKKCHLQIINWFFFYRLSNWYSITIFLVITEKKSSLERLKCFFVVFKLILNYGKNENKQNDWTTNTRGTTTTKETMQKWSQNHAKETSIGTVLFSAFFKKYFPLKFLFFFFLPIWLLCFGQNWTVNKFSFEFFKWNLPCSDLAKNIAIEF